MCHMGATQRVEEPTFVYEFRDSSGVLLYVGITLDLGARLRAHGRQKQWWARVANVQAKLYPTRAEAREVETQLIAEADPEFNVEGHPFRSERQVYTWSLRSLKPREPLPHDKLLDLEEMAAWMRYAPTTTKGYYRRGELPAPDAMVGRKPCWRVATLNAWDAQRKGLVEVEPK